MALDNSKFFGAMRVCSLALALALVGCGSKAQTTEDTSAAKTEEASTKTIVIPEAVSEVTTVSKGLVDGTVAPDTEGFAQLPKAEDDKLQMSKDSDIEEGLDSADKAPSGSILLSQGGIQMQVPASWTISQDEDGFVLQDANGYMTGYMYSRPKQSGASYDLESIAQSVPTNLLKKGFTNVQILSYDTYYSNSGRLCDAVICYSATYQGTNFFFYFEVVESKSYINCVEFYGPYDVFGNVADDVAAATQTVAFNSGEAI